jgi:hypothetical protein
MWGQAHKFYSQGGNNMSVFTGKGKSIKEQMKNRKKASEGEKLDYKKIKINKDLKKAGDSIRVRVLSNEDFTTYEAHGSFEKGIYTTPCIDPMEAGQQRCLLCEASKHESHKELVSATRFMFAFYDIDMEMIRYIDVSYTQGGSLMDDIEENSDSLEEFAFTLKRSGEGTKTTYKLSAILGMKKKDPEAQARFEKAGELKVEDDFFDKALYVKSTNQMGIDLENSGFDVEGLLGYEIKDDTSNEEAQPQTGGDADPEKVF